MCTYYTPVVKCRQNKMSNLLTITPQFSQDTLPADSPTRLLYVLLEFQAADLGNATPLPVNLAMVVDKSDSMCVPILSQEQFEELANMGNVSETMVDGVPVWHFENVPKQYELVAPRSIDFVKRALHSALEQIAPDDHFALVAFARQAMVVIPHQPGKNKRELMRAIETLDTLPLGNDTYMATGMERGLEEVQRSLSRAFVNRMIILTDGFTQDTAQCRALAQQAAQHGIAVSTMGLGVEFNEELLIAMADASGGNAYFIQDPAEIPNAFRQELNGVEKIALRNVWLKMRLMSGIEVRRVHRVKPSISDLGTLTLNDRAFELALGDVAPHSARSFLLELLVPPRPAGNFQLAHLIVEYDVPQWAIERQKVRENLIITFTNDRASAPINPTVMNLAETVSAFKLQTRALQDAARGDVAGATHKLQSAATRLINMGEAELAQQMLNEVANLELRGKMSAEGTKRLRYDTRKLTQKLE